MPSGQPLAERARRGLDARQHHAIGMALQRAAELAQRDELLLGEVAGARHHRVERGHRVALGEHDAIAIGPAGALGVVAQAPEHDRHEQVDHRERAAGMPGARVGQHADDLDAARARDRLELAVNRHGRSSRGSA
jgi:hypothetical protein